MIITLTINPAIDNSVIAGQIVPEKKIRCYSMLVDAGGGGINVSKAIAELGGTSHCIFPRGGHNGQIVENLLHQKGIACSTVTVAAETRESIHIRNAATNAQYRFMLPGASLSEQETQTVWNLLECMDPFPEFVVASGSLPAGVPDDFYGKLSILCMIKGARLILDTSGLPLLEGGQSWSVPA